MCEKAFFRHTLKNRREGYVNTIIYNLHVWNIWQVIDIWIKSGLGSIKVTSDGGVLPGGPDRYGVHGTAQAGIPGSDHCWDCIFVKEELLIKSQQRTRQYQ